MMCVCAKGELGRGGKCGEGFKLESYPKSKSVSVAVVAIASFFCVLDVRGKKKKKKEAELAILSFGPGTNIPRISRNRGSERGRAGSFVTASPSASSILSDDCSKSRFCACQDFFAVRNFYLAERCRTAWLPSCCKIPLALAERLHLGGTEVAAK